MRATRLRAPERQADDVGPARELCSAASFGRVKRVVRINLALKAFDEQRPSLAPLRTAGCQAAIAAAQSVRTTISREMN